MDVFPVFLSYIDKLKAQFIVAAQEGEPLAAFRDVGSHFFAEYISHRCTALHMQGFEHLGHQRKMIAGMAFIAISEIFNNLVRFLTGLGQQEGLWPEMVHHRTEKFNHSMCLGRFSQSVPSSFQK